MTDGADFIGGKLAPSGAVPLARLADDVEFPDAGYWLDSEGGRWFETSSGQAEAYAVNGAIKILGVIGPLEGVWHSAIENCYQRCRN